VPRQRQRPSIEELSRSDCEALLARHHVGRIAFSFKDRVDIEPISYVFRDGWLYGRTSEGAKLTTVEHSRWVALEVDEVDGPFEWRSVVVHGALYRLSPDVSTEEEIERAIRLLRGALPEMGTEADPAPFRKVLFRIHVDEIRGRTARSSPAPG
jgi:nitroimidazol reductase NimA-like FMN-containing flavoprotein (pyridoxamine 5'-phosphate oxidase superfamily)